MVTRTPCPATFDASTRETVRCRHPAGHQHALDATERLEEQHDGFRRDGARVTWFDR